MKYSAIRDQIRTGDVLLCKDRTLSGILIRALTAGGHNHVAIFVWLQDNDLWIAEMTGRYGFKMTRASQYLKERNSQMRWGAYPKETEPDHPGIMRNKILSAKGTRYAWWQLVAAWWSQVTDSKSGGTAWRRHKRKICSTLIQLVWDAIGIKIPGVADPDEIADKCQTLTIIST